MAPVILAGAFCYGRWDDVLCILRRTGWIMPGVSLYSGQKGGLYMDTGIEKKMQSALVNLFALRDFMSYIVENVSEEKIDKYTLLVFMSSLDTAINKLEQCDD